MSEQMRPAVTVYAGRLGANQTYILDRDDPDNKSLLEQTPDAAPEIPWRQVMDLRGFRSVSLWKQAFVEGIGSFVLVFATALMGVSPPIPLPPPSPTAGPFATAQFLGPLIGGVTTVIYITIAILTFGPITGGHLNPFLTLATFMIQLTSLPRAVLYIAFQLGGAVLAGLMVRASYGSRDFKVGGCFLFEEQGATVGGALATEFAGCLSVIILAFGVAIDPRNKQTLGPVLAPFLVGLIVGVLAFGLGFAIPGYGGPSMNPARCFGVYVGSHFPSWHWVHWVGPILAGLAHALMYKAVPPWELRAKVEEVQSHQGKIGMSRNSSGLNGHAQGVLPVPPEKSRDASASGV